MRPSIARALWRDLAAITIGLTDGELRSSIGVLRWASDLTSDPVALRVIGVVTSQAKIDTVVDGTLVVPHRLTSSAEHRFAVEEGLSRAEAMGMALSRAFSVSANVATADDEAAKALTARLMSAGGYWSHLEPSFGRFVYDLASLDASATASPDCAPARWWSEVCTRAARTSFEQAASSMGTQGQALRAAALGRASLERSIARTTDNRTEVTA
jgi:hypothetical protein